MLSTIKGSEEIKQNHKSQEANGETAIDSDSQPAFKVTKNFEILLPLTIRQFCVETKV